MASNPIVLMVTCCIPTKKTTFTGEKGAGTNTRGRPHSPAGAGTNTRGRSHSPYLYMFVCLYVLYTMHIYIHLEKSYHPLKVLCAPTVLLQCTKHEKHARNLRLWPQNTYFLTSCLSKLARTSKQIHQHLAKLTKHIAKLTKHITKYTTHIMFVKTSQN
jgi:hypothetical protein